MNFETIKSLIDLILFQREDNESQVLRLVWRQ